MNSINVNHGIHQNSNIVCGPRIGRSLPQTASLNDLPDDVLVEIFLILYAYWPSRRHVKRAELEVCRRWYNIITKTPLLWTRIYLPLDPNTACGKHQHRLNITYFSRSQNAHIDVHFTPTRHTLEERDCSLAFRNASRIRKLEARFITKQAFHNIFNRDWESLEMLNLQTLTVSDCPKDYFKDVSTDERPLIIQPWKGMDALRTLELYDFPFTDFPPGTGVRSLSLDLTGGTFTLKEVFEHFPRLETLIIHSFDPYPNDGSLIRAPHLRNLAIDSFCLHDATCGCGLKSLVAPNIEIVEYHGTRWSLLNNAHAAILFTSEEEKTRRLRVCNKQRSNKKDLFFYSKLPSHIDLEFAELPGDNADFIVELLSSLGNLRSLTLALYPSTDNVSCRKPRYQPRNLNPANFSQIVRQYKPVLACPTYIRVFDHELIAEDVERILGHHLTVLVSHPVDEAWFCHCNHIPYLDHDWDRFDRFLRKIGANEGDNDS